MVGVKTNWAKLDHVVARAEFPVTPRPAVPAAAGERPVHGGHFITLGPGTFDARTGELLTLNGITLSSAPRLDIWRAPTDNDNGASWQGGQRHGLVWRELGLHRMQHRYDAVELTGGGLTIRTRVAPAARDIGLRTVYRWTSDGDRLTLTVSVTPEGEWTVPLPRLGIRLGLPAAYGYAHWFGGIGEAYPDTAAASLSSRHFSPVDRMQTPYVRPQENGARADVRWAELRAGFTGEGVRMVGEPAFWFTARRWTTEQLDMATHRTDLTPGDTVWVHLDHGQHGIGSQSCGPGVLPRYELHAAPAEFAFTFSYRDATPEEEPPVPDRPGGTSL